MSMRLKSFALVLFLSLAGCKASKDAIDANPDFRKGAIEKGRTSCVDSASKAMKTPKTPEMDAKIAKYCDCFATRGLSQFSNSDLMEMGIRNDIDTNPVFKAKMDSIVNMCVAEAFSK